MSAIADRYRRLADDFATTVAAVPEDRWGDQSPCEDWKARDVVSHVVGTSGMFLGFLGRATGQDVRLDPQDMADVRSSMAGLEDSMRSPGALGPEVTPPPGADEQTAFLA